jgi:hypothetical protein
MAQMFFASHFLSGLVEQVYFVTKKYAFVSLANNYLQGAIVFDQPFSSEQEAYCARLGSFNFSNVPGPGSLLSCKATRSPL